MTHTANKKFQENKKCRVKGNLILDHSRIKSHFTHTQK